MFIYICRFSISTGIGETVVSFAFARPIAVQERNKTILRLKTKEEAPAQLFPIYLLQGNGEVLLLLTSVTDSRYRKYTAILQLITLITAGRVCPVVQWLNSGSQPSLAVVLHPEVCQLPPLSILHHKKTHLYIFCSCPT